jgi:hypothetical protein
MQIRRPFPVEGHGQPQRQSGLISTAPVFVPGASGHITTKAASQRASINRDMADVGRPRIYEHHPYRVSFPADMGPQGNHAVAAMGIAQGRNVVGQPVDPIEARNFVIAPPFELAYSGLSQSSLHEQPLNRQPWIHPLVQQLDAQSLFSQYPAEMAYPTASRLSRTPDCGQELGKRVRKH